jgi:hypothetical protein
MKKETNHAIYLLKTNIANICKCEIERKISFILNKKFQLEKIKVEHEQLTSIKHQLSKEFSDCIENSRSLFGSALKNCHHEYNTLSSDIANFVEKNEKQTLKTKGNAEKVFVAPSEEGKWVNWYSDLFLEEKLFPKLFSYGIGGYLSSNMLKKSDMGYANYIKNSLGMMHPICSFCFWSRN